MSHLTLRRALAAALFLSSIGAAVAAPVAARCKLNDVAFNSIEQGHGSHLDVSFVDALTGNAFPDGMGDMNGPLVARPNTLPGRNLFETVLVMAWGSALTRADLVLAVSGAVADRLVQQAVL